MADVVRRFEDPFGDLMERLWERATGAAWPVAMASNARQTAVGRFPCNVYEDGSNYYMTCMVPGLRPESIEITTEGDVLTVAGAYEPHVPDGATVVVQELGPVQ